MKLKSAKNLRIILSIVTLGAIALSAHAQTAPEFFITWRAGDYASSAFQGKILPVAGTPVAIGFELIDGGKIADISKSAVSFMLNGKKFASGLGLKTAVFTTDPLILNAPEIKIDVGNYKGAPVDTLVRIPNGRPEAIIRSPYPGNIITAGKNSFDASFYYWNVNSPDRIGIAWSLNGAATGGSGLSSNLAVTVPDNAAGSSFTLGLSAKNLDNEFEFANDSVNLVVVK